MRGLALAALLLPAAAAPVPGAGAVPGAAGPFKWHFFPLHVLSGQVKVICGGGFVVEWFVQVGDYVKEGDPVCETCPRGAGGGTSVTCTAPASGQVVAGQPLSPHDDVLSNVPDGVLAVIQPSGGAPRALRSGGECHAVECKAGVTFGQFLVDAGDYVHRGDVVALALTAEGTVDHCRAPVDGRASLAAHVARGQDMAGLEPRRTVGCVAGPGPRAAAAAAAEPAARPGSGAGTGHHTCRAPEAGAGGGAGVVGVAGAAGAAAEPGAVAEVAAASSAGGASGASGAGGASGASGTSAGKRGAAGPRRSRAAAAGEPNATHHARPRQSLPLAGLERRADRGRLAALGGGDRAAALARPALLFVWVAAGLAAVSSLLLGAFVLCGKSQTRSLYMLMQDAREDVAKGLRVDFRDGSGCEKSFCFESQPLGIVFSKQSPVRVERFEFNSYAKDRGVQLGWTISRIAQQEITGQHSPPDVDRMLHGHVKTLAFWPLRVDFDTGNGAIKAFYFVKQPLGVEITRHAPFRIALFKPDSYARTCGVQLGWVIVRVGDAVVNQRTSFGALSAYFESGLSHLPQEPKGLRMDFSDPATGKERVFYFQRRPLGLVLTRYKPVRVQGFEFNSYAKERGVQPGWTVARIGDQAVPSGLSSEQVDRRILENSATLAVWPLRMDFDTGRGVRTFYFERQPLGMELLNKLPIRVDTFKPDSYAKACGVQLGWVITRVGDHEVTRETRFEQVIECLVEGVCELPPADATRPPGRPAPGVQRGSRSSAC